MGRLISPDVGLRDGDRECMDERKRYGTSLEYERNAFLWRTLVPLAVFSIALFTLWSVPYSTGTFLAIILPFYAGTVSVIASASLRFGRHLGYSTEAVTLLMIPGLMSCGIFTMVFLLHIARREEKREGR